MFRALMDSCGCMLRVRVGRNVCQENILPQIPTDETQAWPDAFYLQKG